MDAVNLSTKLSLRSVSMEASRASGATASRLIVKFGESSSPGEFHPQALTDPDVNVSAHPALIIQQSLFLATLPYLLASPITG